MAPNMEVVCARCLDAFEQPVNLAMAARGWETIEARCPNCGAALRIGYDLRPHVNFVRLANGDYPVVLSLDSIGDHHGTP